MIAEALLPAFVHADVWVQLAVTHPLAALLAVTLLAVTATALVGSVRRVRRTELVVRPHRPTRVGRPVVLHALRPRAPVLLASGHGARAPGAIERHRTPS